MARHGRENITCLRFYWWTVLILSLREASSLQGGDIQEAIVGLVCLFMDCGFSWLLTGCL